MKGSFKNLSRLALALLAVCGLVSSLSVAQAATTEQKVLRVTSDAMEGNLFVHAILDENAKITGLRYESPYETKTFPITNLAQGIVMYSIKGMNVVTLKSAKFDPANGGPIDVVYIANGLTGSYRTYPAEMNRVGQTWELLINDQAGRRPVKHIYLKAKKVLGKIVGIDQVIPQDGAKIMAEPMEPALPGIENDWYVNPALVQQGV